MVGTLQANLTVAPPPQVQVGFAGSLQVPVSIRKGCTATYILFADLQEYQLQNLATTELRALGLRGSGSAADEEGSTVVSQPSSAEASGEHAKVPIIAICHL